MKTKDWAKLLVAGQVFAAALWAADAPPVISLWPGDAPGSEGKTGEEKMRLSPEGEHVWSGIHHPSLTVYLPPKDKATGAAVVVIPAADTGNCGWTMKGTTSRAGWRIMASPGSS